MSLISYEKRSIEGILESGHSKFDVLSNMYKEGYKEYIEGSAIPKAKEGRYCYPKTDAFLNYEPKIMRSPKFPELFDSEKLIIRGSSGAMGILATFDDRKLYTPHKITIIIKKSDLPKSNDEYEVHANYNLKFLLSLINSSIFHFYYSSVFGGFIDVYPNSLKALPIPKLKNEDQLPFIEKADIMLSKTKELDDLRTKFLNFIKSKYKIENPSNKLQGWVKLEFSEFVNELTKQKIKLSTSDEYELMQLFDKEMSTAKKLKEILTNTDNEINNLIYNLYELTDDEKKIIETDKA